MPQRAEIGERRRSTSARVFSVRMTASSTSSTASLHSGLGVRRKSGRSRADAPQRAPLSLARFHSGEPPRDQAAALTPPASSRVLPVGGAPWRRSLFVDLPPLLGLRSARGTIVHRISLPTLQHKVAPCSRRLPELGEDPPRTLPTCPTVAREQFQWLKAPFDQPERVRECGSNCWLSSYIHVRVHHRGFAIALPSIS